MEGDIGNGKCINLVKVDADAVAVTPSSKQQELHTSERTIVSQTVIFVIVFVVDVQFWVVYMYTEEVLQFSFKGRVCEGLRGEYWK